MNARSYEDIRIRWVCLIAFLMMAGFADALRVLMLDPSASSFGQIELVALLATLQVFRLSYWLVLITTLAAGIWRATHAIWRAVRT